MYGGKRIHGSSASGVGVRDGVGLCPPLAPEHATSSGWPLPDMVGHPEIAALNDTGGREATPEGSVRNAKTSASGLR